MTQQSKSKNNLHLVAKIAGVTYVLAWVIGLSSGAANLSLHQTTTTIVKAVAGKPTNTALQYIFAEAIAGLALLVTVNVVARLAHKQAKQPVLKWFQAAGSLSAIVSVAMCVMGLLLISYSRSAAQWQHVEGLYNAINRIDGPKMWALALMAFFGVRAMPQLPKWSSWTGYALAASLVASGVSYAFLLESLNWTVYIAGVLLLVWVGSLGFVVRPRAAN